MCLVHTLSMQDSMASWTCMVIDIELDDAGQCLPGPVCQVPICCRPGYVSIPCAACTASQIRVLIITIECRGCYVIITSDLSPNRHLLYFWTGSNQVLICHIFVTAAPLLPCKHACHAFQLAQCTFTLSTHTKNMIIC